VLAVRRARGLRLRLALRGAGAEGGVLALQRLGLAVPDRAGGVLGDWGLGLALPRVDRVGRLLRLGLVGRLLRLGLVGRLLRVFLMHGLVLVGLLCHVLDSLSGFDASQTSPRRGLLGAA
jgi:hypothetical protein